MRNAILTRRAKEMRKAMPAPEVRLWFELRAGRFQSVKFRRQKVIGDCIADFASNHPRLVIELDGDSHAGHERYDATQTLFLEKQGYRVVRFANSDVMRNMDGFLQRLTELVEEMGHSPPPPPSPEGEGARV